MKRWSLLYGLPLFAYVGGIFYLANRSLSAPTIGLPHVDKLVHLAIYSIAGFLGARALLSNPWQRLSQAMIMVITIATVFIIGISDEFFQSMTPGRQPSVWDVLADVCGGSLGIGAKLLFDSGPKQS